MLTLFPGLARASLALALSCARSSAGRRFAAPLTGVVMLGLLPGLQPPASAGLQVPATLAAGGAWLDRLNLWRASAGQPPLTENPTWSAGDYNHAVYMVKNNLVTHSETPGVPYYTTSGDYASQNSNIYVSSSTGTTDEQAIDWWMGAPFHAMAMVDPRLTQTGFGSYRDSATSPWQMGAALNVISGNSFTGGQFPVYFPGNQSTEPLTAYSGNEFPDPTSACPGYAGLPVFIEVGGNVSTVATAHSISANGTALNTCVIDTSNAGLSSYLKARGGVIVMPQQHLQSGVKYTVALTVNGVAYSWTFTVGPFTVAPPPAGWQSLGGYVTSGPGASSWAATRADVFVRGPDNQMWHNWKDGTQWNGWQPLGGYLTTDPNAISWGPNRIDTFVRGPDMQLYHEWWDGVRWNSWQPLGGRLTSGPGVSSWASGRLDVFARGPDNQLYHEWWDGVRWNSWQPLGGVLTSDPTAVSWGPNRIDVFALGLDSQLWHTWWDGVRWNAWQPLGGSLTASPVAASCSSGHLDVIAQGSDKGLWQLGYNGTAWTGWKPLGGSWTSRPSAVCPAGTGSVAVFARFSDNALWTASVPGT